MTPELKHDVSDFALDRPRTRILYTVNEDGYTRTRGLDARTYKPLTLPTLARGGPRVRRRLQPQRPLRRAGRRHAARPRWSSFVLDWKSGKLTQWQLPSAPEVDPTRFARATLEHYPARDGTRIPMFVRRPEKCAGANCPVVVVFHGGPEGQAQPGLLHLRPALRRRRLHPGRAQRARQRRLRQDLAPRRRRRRSAWTSSPTSRTAPATSARSGRRTARPPRLAIVGGSYGGYSTLIGMTMFAGAYDVGRVGGGPVQPGHASWPTPRLTAGPCGSPSTATPRRTGTPCSSSPRSPTSTG